VLQVLWGKHEGDGKQLTPTQSMLSGFLAACLGPIATGEAAAAAAAGWGDLGVCRRGVGLHIPGQPCGTLSHPLQQLGTHAEQQQA
jgi:hypothetical protein